MCIWLNMYVNAHMYMFMTFHNGFMFVDKHLLHKKYTYFCTCHRESSLEATTFEMELRGHKQATAHSHEHTKKLNPSKKIIFATTKFEFESAN